MACIPDTLYQYYQTVLLIAVHNFVVPLVNAVSKGSTPYLNWYIGLVFTWPDY